MEERSMIEQLRIQLNWTKEDMEKFLEEIAKVISEEVAVGAGESDIFKNMSDHIYKKRIAKLLMLLGIPTNIGGYKFIKLALVYLRSKESEKISITEELYPYIAKFYNKTVGQVERAIRSAVEMACKVNSVKFQEIFDNINLPKSGKPTNSLFITALDEYLRYN